MIIQNRIMVMMIIIIIHDNTHTKEADDEKEKLRVALSFKPIETTDVGRWTKLA